MALVAIYTPPNPNHVECCISTHRYACDGMNLIDNWQYTHTLMSLYATEKQWSLEILANHLGFTQGSPNYRETLILLSPEGIQYQPSTQLGTFEYAVRVSVAMFVARLFNPPF